MKLRRAGPADTHAICEFLGEVFEENPKTDPEVLTWQYWDNPFGSALVWIIEVEGRIVSLYSAIPIPMLIGGKVSRGALGVDGATAASHRRRGLYEKTAFAAFSDCCNQGMRVMFAIRSATPLPMHQWKTSIRAGPLRLFVWPIDEDWTARRLRLTPELFRPFRRLAFPRTEPLGERVPGPPVGIDELWKEVASDYPFGVVRDEAWWRWRYAGHPASPYRYWESRRGAQLRAAAVTIDRDSMGGRFVYVMELLAADREGARVVVSTMVSQSEDFSGIAMIALPGSAPAVSASAAGLRKVPRRLEAHPAELFIRDTCLESHGPASAPWSVTWGEFDYL